MIMKTIKYTDYEGVERTESFFFNLSKAELISMDAEVEGGFKKMIEKVIESQDPKQIIEIFKDIIYRSYGEKSPDGRRFIKSKELSDGFTQTEMLLKLRRSSKASCLQILLTVLTLLSQSSLNNKD